MSCDCKITHLKSSIPSPSSPPPPPSSQDSIALLPMPYPPLPQVRAQDGCAARAVCLWRSCRRTFLLLNEIKEAFFSKNNCICTDNSSKGYPSPGQEREGGVEEGGVPDREEREGYPCPDCGREGGGTPPGQGTLPSPFLPSLCEETDKLKM